MEYRQLFEFLRGRFDFADEPREAVLRATAVYGGKPYTQVYFDCTQHLVQPRFDLSHYQQDLLATDYYSQPGSLQWNFYLYLLCEREAYEQLRNSRKTELIESDKTFARKFVRTPDELMREITEATAPSSTRGSAAEGDLSIRWIGKLKSKRLDGVFLKEEGYQRVIDSYLADSPVIQDEGDATRQDVDADVDIAFVNTLSVKSPFRVFAPQRFDFGLVNLIHGPNGSGKTSLLEAIELCICGSSYRNRDEEEPVGAIEVHFEGQDSPQVYDPSNNSLFRKRDRRWYRNYYMRGNHLCIGFNRFNFYDTDAGIRAARPGGSDKSVQDAIASLLIGENANIIQERAEKFLEYFQAKRASCERLVSEVSTRKSQNEEELSRLEIPSTDQTPLRDMFISQFQACRWRSEMPSITREALDLLANDIDQVILRLESGLAEVDWMREPTHKGILEERDRLAQAQANVTELRHESQSLRHSLQELTERLEPIGHLTALFRRLEPYLIHEDALQLLNLGTKMTDLENLARRLGDASAFVGTMDLSRYESTTQGLSAYRNALAEQLERAETQKRQLDLQIQNIQSATERLRSVVSEIRAKADELIHLQPDRADCPVCRAHYARGELARRLREEEVSENLQPLTELLSARDQADVALLGLTAQHEEVGRMMYALSLAGASDEEISVRDAVQILKRLPTQMRETEATVASYRGLRARLEVERLIESELAVLAGSLAAAGITIDLDESHRHELQVKKRDIEDAFRDLTQQRIHIEDQLASNERATGSLLASAFPDLAEIASAEAVLEGRHDRILHAVNLVGEVEQKVDLNRTETLDEILLQVKSVKLSCQNLARSIPSAANESRLSELRQRIQSDMDELTTLTQQLELVKAANDVLNEILTIDSKEKYLESFFQVHKRGILQIFTSIHAPKEFTDIEFQHDDSPEIRLVTGLSSEKRSLSQISTGQRSAFALSIFLALNGMLQLGPALILLDDPVAHVDDLNTLSFMDYLRRLVIERKRQVFFATANPKLVNLFRRKFDFLGEKDFRVIDLPRR